MDAWNVKPVVQGSLRQEKGLRSRAVSSVTLGVIIVTYNSSAVLPHCIESLAAALDHANGCGISADVVIVDNASREPPSNSLGLSFELIQLAENLGFAPAVNIGLARLAETDFVLLLNPDTRIEADSIARMVSLARDRNAALVGPLLVDELGKPNGYSERPFHSVRWEIARQWIGRTPPIPAGKVALRTGAARCLTGACLLVDGPFFRRVGGLDAVIPMYLEDVELAASAHREGLPVLLDVKSRCVHALGGSSEGKSFATAIGLRLMLLAARVEFVRRRSHVRSSLLRVVILTGALSRWFVETARRKRLAASTHLAVARWALTSGLPPQWPLADTADERTSS